MGLRINHNLASLSASMNLGRANAALSSSLSKLSTGLKINSASDGPADLIISEKFRSQINAISKATENTQNAISMLSTAEGSLNEVNSLLSKMQGLALKAAQTGSQSTDEIAASQAEIDAALESINTISRNTSFGSINLLDGSQAVRTQGVDTKNVSVNIDKANFAGNTKKIDISVVTAANRASTDINLTAAAQGTGATDGVLLNNQVIKVTGNRGSDTLTFAAGSSAESIATEINSRVTQTGVYAEVKDNKVKLMSAQYGASEFVTVEDVDGTNNILDITAGGAANASSNMVKVADLTKGSGGAGFDLGGVQFRAFGAGAEKFQGYTVNATFLAGATASVAVNTTSKTITITAPITLTASAIADSLATKMNVSVRAFHSGTQLLTTTDSATGLIMKDMGQDLQISIRGNTTADKHAIAPTLSIMMGAAAFAYNSVTNKVTLTLASNVVYSTAGLYSLAATTSAGNFFDFNISGGKAMFTPTTINKGVAFSPTSVSTASLSLDLSNHAGTGYAFKSGTTFGFTLNAKGAAIYKDYTVSYTSDAAATAGVSINNSSKTINIVAKAGTTTNLLTIGSLNSSAGAAYFTSIATVPGAGVQGTGSASNTKLTPNGSGLQVTYKGAATGIAPKINITNGANETVRYVSATNTVSITLLAQSFVMTTQAQFDSVLNVAPAKEGAAIRGLFDFKVVGAIDSATQGAIKLTPGGVALGAGSSGTNTNYVKATGSDGSLEVNGIRTAANNLNFTFDNGNIRGTVTIDESFNAAGKKSSFTIGGKGAYLQIGAKSQLSNQIGVGIKSVAADQLASGLYLDTKLDPATAAISNTNLYTIGTLADVKSGGKFDLATNASTAYDIISKAVNEVSVARSKLGALISNTLESNINSLGVAFENLTASESRIRDVDFASETANFTRAQILVQAGTSVASQANVATQAALQLLK